MNRNTHFVPYVYTYPSLLKVAQIEGRLKVKIGDTHRGVDEGFTSDVSGNIRVSEQQGTSNAETPIILHTWHQEKTNVFRRDYNLHAVLKVRGRHITDAGGKEWFYLKYPKGAAFDEGKAAALTDLNVFVKRLTGDHIRHAVRIRKRQEFLLTQAMAAIEKKGLGNVCKIIAFLCPRFGKTIWALELFRRVNAKYGNDVMILPAYMLSAHTSFANEIVKYAEYRNMVFIEARDDLREELDLALREGKLAVVSVSMHAVDIEQFTPLRELDDGRKFEFVDEGDFGAWTEKSREVSNSLSNGVSTAGVQVKVDASGTNLYRLARGMRGQEPDAVLQVAYCELEKHEEGTVRRAFYQMELTDKALAQWIESEGNFSWTRAWRNVDMSAPVLRQLMTGLFDDPENKSLKFLSLNPILEKDCEVAMCFTTAWNEELLKFGDYVRKWLPDYEIIVLCGSADNIISTTNAEAEAIVQVAVEEAKRKGQRGVIVLTNLMGTRSFSVPEVEAAIIMRDGGQLSNFTQSGLRTCTSGTLYNGKKKERGVIVSLSIDPNRDNVKEMLVEEARIVMQNNPDMGLPEALRDYVLDTVSIFRKNPIPGVSSYVKLEKQELMAEITTTNGLIDVANAMSSVQAILESDEAIAILQNVKITDNKGKEKANPLLTKGKTYAIDRKKPERPPGEEDTDLDALIKAVIESLSTLNETATSVLFMSDMENGRYGDVLDNIANDTSSDEEFRSHIGIGAADARRLLDLGFLRGSLLDMIVEISAHEIEIRKYEAWGL